ncbi:MAG: AraC family transcriptional regulator [Bacteroidales bacterium]|nr:AraC family transcriptional regulator [Bacteroidales bacterium]
MFNVVLPVKLQTMASRTITNKDYNERINKVIHFIHTHLSEKLDVDRLAAVAAFSPYHFHRIMSAYLNESLISYIIRTKMEVAAGFILHTDMSITDVAYKVGYEMPSSFNKAFKKRFGVNPSAFRDNYDKARDYLKTSKTNKMKKTEMKHEVREVIPRKVIYVASTGPYDGKGTADAWKKVCGFAGQKGLFGPKTEFIGISFDDPHITDSSKLRYEACLTIDKEATAEGEMGVKEIAGGKYVVFLHEGSYENFQASYDYIFGEWLPGNNSQLREEPSFELYLNSPEDTAPENLKTEIWVPID